MAYDKDVAQRNVRKEVKIKEPKVKIVATKPSILSGQYSGGHLILQFIAPVDMMLLGGVIDLNLALTAQATVKDKKGIITTYPPIDLSAGFSELSALSIALGKGDKLRLTTTDTQQYEGLYSILYKVL